MRSTTRDILSAVLAVVGGVVVFARLESYSWWLIGSWKGAVGVIAVLGLGILLTNISEVVKVADVPSFLELFVWLIAGTVAISSLFVTTNRNEFISTSILIGLAWLAQTTRHLWRAERNHKHHYMPVL